MDVQAILFDVFGTVVDWRGSLIAELSEWGAARGIGADWTGLVDTWRGAYAPSMDRVRRGELPWTKLDDLHMATLREIGPRFGLVGLPDADMEWVNRGWHRLRPWPDSVPGLRALHPRYILGPLSNGNVSLLVDMARGAGLPWDVILGAEVSGRYKPDPETYLGACRMLSLQPEQVMLCAAHNYDLVAEVSGHYKPDPETYLGACRMLSLQPEQVMLCAAHNYDLVAAQKLGLRTAFVPRPTEYGPLQVRDFGPEGEWDVVASDMEDFAARMLA